MTIEGQIEGGVAHGKAGLSRPEETGEEGTIDLGSGSTRLGLQYHRRVP